MTAAFRLINRESDVYSAPTPPEKDLLMAILDRAVLDFHSGNLALKKAARDWIFEGCANDDGQYFSFLWVCSHLDLEPSEVQRSIKGLQLSKRPPQGHRWLRRKVKGQRPRQVA